MSLSFLEFFNFNLQYFHEFFYLCSIFDDMQPFHEIFYFWFRPVLIHSVFTSLPIFDLQRFHEFFHFWYAAFSQVFLILTQSFHKFFLSLSVRIFIIYFAKNDLFMSSAFDEKSTALPAFSESRQNLLQICPFFSY